MADTYRDAHLVDEKASDKQVSTYAGSLAPPDPVALKRGTLKMDFICAWRCQDALTRLTFTAGIGTLTIFYVSLRAMGPT
jgi:hypothetical protein